MEVTVTAWVVTIAVILVLLAVGPATVLAFIGVKLAVYRGHTLSGAVPEVPTLASPGVIVAIPTAASAAERRMGR